MKDLVALNLHMIVTIVDGGMGEDVIDFSKEAGAAGGTILHGRGSGVHDSGKFLGLDISPEKRSLRLYQCIEFINDLAVFYHD